MVTAQKLWLAAATLIAVATASISPVQALTLNFHFTSVPQAPQYNLLTGITGGSLTIDDQFAYLNISAQQNDYNSNSQIKLGNFVDITSNPIAVNKNSYWLFMSTDIWDFSGSSLPDYLPIFWNMVILCESQLINCSGVKGVLLTTSGVPVLGTLYGGAGDIIIDSISLSQPPTPPNNSVPEPSLVLPLFLLGGSWLLGSKLQKLTLAN